MNGDHDAWLARGEEDALEPDLPICDAHHHLWDRPDHRYLPGEFRRDAAKHCIESTVFVECGAGLREHGDPALRPVGETEFVERLVLERRGGGHDEPRIAAGLVGHADLLRGADVGRVLDAHLDASPDRFRGVRHSAAWHPSDRIRRSHADPPPHMLLDPGFREGFAQLAPRNLSFDAWLFHTQLDELTDLARAFPETSIVLDHVGGPLGIGPYEGRRAEVFDAWAAGIAALAGCENVVVKIGGLSMPICGFGWHEGPMPPSSTELAATLRPWILHVIDAFGPTRCMFESNFPVDKASCSYTVLWNAFKRLTSDFPPAERAALFRDTARRFYRLA